MTKPIFMGGLMGAMMLWMLHGALTGGGVSGWALVAFVGAHVVLASVTLIAAVFAARLSPRMRAVMARLHRPSLGHLCVMLAAAAFVVIAVHLGAHGLGDII